jgi:hypothetical protein
MSKTTEFQVLLNEIAFIKEYLIFNGDAFGGWMPKKAVMRYFDYGDTQLRMLERKNAIQVSVVGNRKFYSVQSIIQLIEKNKKS